MTTTATWDWEGTFDCPECGEEFHFQREDGFPDKWNLQLWHDHTSEGEPVWRAAAYKTWKGRRRPDAVKQLQEGVKEQRRNISTAGHPSI